MSANTQRLAPEKKEWLEPFPLRRGLHGFRARIRTRRSVPKRSGRSTRYLSPSRRDLKARSERPPPPTDPPGIATTMPLQPPVPEVGGAAAIDDVRSPSDPRFQLVINDRSLIRLRLGSRSNTNFSHPSARFGYVRKKAQLLNLNGVAIGRSIVVSICRTRSCPTFRLGHYKTGPGPRGPGTGTRHVQLHRPAGSECRTSERECRR